MSATKLSFAIFTSSYPRKIGPNTSLIPDPAPMGVWRVERSLFTLRRGIIQTECPIFIHPVERPIHPDPEPEPVTPRVIFLAYTRVVEVSQAVILIERNQQISISYRNVAGHMIMFPFILLLSHPAHLIIRGMGSGSPREMWGKVETRHTRERNLCRVSIICLDW